MQHNNNQDEERLAFLDQMKDVQPISQNDTVRTIQPKNTLAQQLKRQALEVNTPLANNYLSIEKVQPVDPYDHISYKQDGIQSGVFKNLRLGKYKIDKVINLQQKSFEQARSFLFSQVLESHKTGYRSVLVKHGLGLHSSPFAGFLKSYVNQWLRQMPEVIAFYTAQTKHGGNSAVYVLIKKNQQQKISNRELYGNK